jgi:hypothetical protein
MNTEQHAKIDTDEDSLLPPVEELTLKEARQLFEENARYWMGMSGHEFIRMWRNGAFGDVDHHPDHLRLMEVASLLPLVAEDADEA